MYISQKLANSTNNDIISKFNCVSIFVHAYGVLIDSSDECTLNQEGTNTVATSVSSSETMSMSTSQPLCSPRVQQGLLPEAREALPDPNEILWLSYE